MLEITKKDGSIVSLMCGVMESSCVDAPFS